MNSIYAIILAALFTPLRRRGWGLNLLIVGPPGGGKTAIVEEACRRAGLKSWSLPVNLMEAPEFNGYPMRTKAGTMAYAHPAWAGEVAAHAEDFGGAVVNLDELNTGTPPVLAACMKMTLEKRCGSFSLGENTRFIAMINPTGIAESAGGIDIPPALANRFGWLDMPPIPFDDWAAHVLDEDLKDFEAQDLVDPESKQAEILRVWPEVYQRHATSVLSYLEARPAKIHSYPKHAADASGPWPSNRTWHDGAIRALASAEIHNLSADDRLAFVGAFVGAPAALEYETWRTQADLPNPTAWLAGKAEFVPDKTRLDRTHAFLIGVAMTLTKIEPGKRDTELLRFFEFCAEGLDGAKDLAVHATRYIARDGAGRLTTTEIKNLPKDLGKFVADLGAFSRKVN